MEIPTMQYLHDAEQHEFQVPVKKINDGRDVSHFLTSKAYSDVMTFLLQLNRAMFPRKVPSTQQDPSGIQVWKTIEVFKKDPVWKIQALLTDLENIIDEVPLDTGPRRFGNVSFRKWYQRIEEQATDLLQKWIPISSAASSETTFLDEIKPYFLGSFGSAQRLDYGSGHELSFLAFLGCIWKVGGFLGSELIDSNRLQDDQSRAVILGPMQDYFRLVRRLIKTYTLEPAGSHGVWGLDDHSFLPYIFGSAQYGPAISDADETPIEGSLAGSPKSADIAKIAAVNRYRDSNLYFAAIGFIHDVKTGPFWEHSPMLYDISGVKDGWGKINKGMIKMYNAEVLSKFPVVQHFPFGSLFSWETDPNAPAPPSSVHASSQPFSLNSGVKSSSTEKIAPSRPGLEGSTKAPWATTTTTKLSNLHMPTTGTSRSSAPLAQGPVRRLAPQSAQGPAPSADPPMGSGTRFAIQSAESDRKVRQPDVPDVTDNTANTASMPPPTRAPWAKEP